MKIPAIIYSLQPVGIHSVSAERKTNPKSEITPVYVDRNALNVTDKIYSLEVTNRLSHLPGFSLFFNLLTPNRGLTRGVHNVLGQWRVDPRLRLGR